MKTITLNDLDYTLLVELVQGAIDKSRTEGEVLAYQTVMDQVMGWSVIEDAPRLEMEMV